MNEKKSYAGIDRMRFIAAFLIVAIHTSPLAAQSITADFVLTRVIARVAVPFFFMTSGFFLISKYGRADKLKQFLKKTAVIYGTAILLYITVNIYNGYFTSDDLLPKLIKDVVFDGTFYHLWYLPASMLGAVIAWYAVKRLGFKKALAVTSALYLIGTLGNSWYAFVSQVPAAKGFYGLLGQISDYTRNGIFFAPVFMVLGGWIAEERLKKTDASFSFKIGLVGLAVSFALMLGEAFLLRNYVLSKTDLPMNRDLADAILQRDYGEQRNDSMYLFLLSCMYFLFDLLLRFGGKRRRELRSLSLIIYIVHPMMILVVRVAARILGIWHILVNNSIVHYLAVSLLSFVFAYAALLIWEKKKRPSLRARRGRERAWIETDMGNLAHNAAALRGAMQDGCGLMAVVKADAYGHGAYDTAVCLERQGVNAFAVATVDEGIELRKYGISGDILILGYTDPRRAVHIRRYRLTQTVLDLKYARLLERQKKTVAVHIKIDTGMRRLGIDAEDIESVERVFSMEHIKVRGIYSHLCCSDSLNEEDVFFTESQIERFERLLDRLRADGFEPGKTHIQSSYGLMNYPELRFDYVRAGIALYGVLSDCRGEVRNPLDLRPVLSLRSRVVLIREVKKGESCGYGRAFTAKRDSLIAILPIGYCDGVPRSLSEGVGAAEIRGRTAPFAGRVCMDSVAVDVTDIEDIAVGDVATLISDDPQSPLYAPLVAERTGSISNELLCRMGDRLE